MAKARGEAPISEEDLLRLLRASAGAVLVGGQALAFWLAWFRIDVSDGQRVMSWDADFVGLDAAAVKRRAIEVTHPGDPALRFLVMDPVDCLASRIENLRRLADKKNDVGVWQAAKAIAVCRAYVQALVREDSERKAIKVATALFRLAGSAAGLQAYARFRLDILEGVPLDDFSSGSFLRQQARRSVAAILTLRTGRS